MEECVLMSTLMWVLYLGDTSQRDISAISRRAHRRVDDLLVLLGDPVDVAAGDRRARREDELEHRALLIHKRIRRDAQKNSPRYTR